MEMQKILVLIGLILLFLGCGASQKIYKTNAALDQMMTEKKFEIKAGTALPMVTLALSQVALSGLIPPGSNINRIDLSGSNSYLKIWGDSVSANLPYYGERRLGGGYNNVSGIEFNGKPETIEIIKDDVKQNYTIKFSIRNQTESFIVNATTNTNLTSTIYITSSHRTRIRYMGVIKELKSDK